MEDNEILKLINLLQPDKDLRGDSTVWANWMSQLTPTLTLNGVGVLLFSIFCLSSRKSEKGIIIPCYSLVN